jgi:hypothetical protein
MVETSPQKRKYNAIKKANDDALGALSDRRLAKRLKDNTPDWSTSYTRTNKNGVTTTTTRNGPSARTLGNMRKRGTFEYIGLRISPHISEPARAERVTFTTTRLAEELDSEVHVDESMAVFTLNKKKFKGIMVQGESLRKADMAMSMLPVNQEPGEFVGSRLTDLTLGQQQELDDARKKANIRYDESSRLHPPQVLLFGAICCPQPDDSDATEYTFEDAAHPIVMLCAVLGRRPRLRNKKDKEGNVIKGPGTDDPWIYVPVTINQYGYREIILGEGGLLDMIEHRLQGKDVEERVKKFYLPVDPQGNVDTKELERRHDERMKMQNANKRQDEWQYLTSAVQEDGAPAHGYSNSKKGDDKSTLVHKTLVEGMARRGYSVFKQPRNSPELNACDLGFWHMVKTALDDRISEVPLPMTSVKTSTENKMWEIIREEAIKLPAQKFFNIFRQQRANMDAIKDAKGNPLDAFPRLGARRQFGTIDQESVASIGDDGESE